MSDRTAIYAGTFDPPTNGHLWLIKTAAEIFKKIVVAIGINADKRPLFTPEERVAMLLEATATLDNVYVETIEKKFVAKYAQQKSALILRGVRNGIDLEYEHAMRHMNADIAPDVHTVFMLPPRELSEISSSMIKGFVGLDGWQDVVRRYVPQATLQRLLIKFPA